MYYIDSPDHAYQLVYKTIQDDNGYPLWYVFLNNYDGTENWSWSLCPDPSIPGQSYSDPEMAGYLTFDAIIAEPRLQNSLRKRLLQVEI